MNIALCFSGQVREFQLTRNSLNRLIFNSLKRHHLYFFAHTPREPEKRKYLGIDFHSIIEEDESKLTIPSPPVGCHQVASRSWHQGDSYRAFYLQLRSINRSNQLQKEYAEKHSIHFDWVFRLRFDNLYFGAPLEDLSLLPSDAIYIPRHDNWWGYNDRFAFGPAALMDHYGKRSDHFLDYQQQGHQIHPEKFLKWVLTKYAVNVRRTAISHHILRYGKFERAVADTAYGDHPADHGFWTSKAQPLITKIVPTRLHDAWRKNRNLLPF